MTNWKTSLGGAIGAAGTSLMGIGVLTQLAPLLPTAKNMIPDDILKFCWWLAVAGFVLAAVGKSLTSFFAADAEQLGKLAGVVQQHADVLNSLPPNPGTPRAAPAVDNTPKSSV